MYIPSEKIDYIQSTVPIEDVIRATGYQIVGTGRSLGVESCPSCGRDYTHVKINQRKNLFNCYSNQCQFKGNQFQWVMEVEKVAFVDAVIRVAAIAGIDITPDEEISEYETRRQKALRLALSFYRRQKNNYLENRGISQATADAFFAGYAPGGTALKEFLNEKGFTNDFLTEIGLVRLVQGKKLMDRFYQSVIIPDVRNGRIYDFYGRSINENVKSKHIYLYGQRSFIGWHLVKPGRQVIISEAPIDAMSNYQLTGIASTSVGGAGKFGSWHLYHIRSEKVKPIYGYDNDESGRLACVDAVTLSKEYNIASQVVAFQNVKDSNELLKNGGTKKEMLGFIMDGERFVHEYQLSQIPLPIIQEYLKKSLEKKLPI